MLRIVALLFSILVAVPALAEDFPGSQPIKIVVPFAPGGTTDLLGRVVAEFLQKQMNHTIIVENRPGAATLIGTDAMAKSAPDGHTVLLAAADLAVLPGMRRNLPYDIEKFTYLTRFFVNLPLIVTGPNSDISSLEDLVAKIKANPGKYKHATNGVGSLTHFGSLKFDAAIGGKTVAVPYGGQGPGSIDTISGTVAFQHGASVPLAPGLRVLGPSGNRRHPEYPNLPTMAELGYKNADWSAWFGFVAPPDTPKPIADRLIKEINTVLKEPELIEKLRTAAKWVPETNPLTGDDFKKLVLDDLKSWKEIAERENLVVQ